MKLRIPIEATNVFWEVAKRALGSGLKMNEMSVVFCFWRWSLFVPFTPLKTNMYTQNDGLQKVTPLNMAILGIYVRFLECISCLFSW